MCKQYFTIIVGRTSANFDLLINCSVMSNKQYLSNCKAVQQDYFPVLQVAKLTTRTTW